MSPLFWNPLGKGTQLRKLECELFSHASGTIPAHSLLTAQMAQPKHVTQSPLLCNDAPGCCVPMRILSGKDRLQKDDMFDLVCFNCLANLASINIINSPIHDTQSLTSRMASLRLGFDKLGQNDGFAA